MSNPQKKYKDIPRQEHEARTVSERLRDYAEIYLPASQEHIQQQADRCMDCGIPFCHAAGCPISNLIPDFNDCVQRGRWKEACDILHSQCNFPEFTGRLCPALCEHACTLGVGFEPVTIRELEWEIVEQGFRRGYIVARPPKTRTGKRVAVVGSGPAGLVAAQQLNWAGHSVTVYEADDRIGGFLRYGVPDFKMEKWVIDRRVNLLKEEGVVFETGVHIGEDISARYLKSRFDAICLCSGSRAPRDLAIPGRDLKGIHFALEYLEQSNRRQAGDQIAADAVIDARDKIVVVLGGGDTGSDCIGTANRQGARKVYQYELLPKPPEERTRDMPWPEFARIHKTTSSHEEGCERRWNIDTTAFNGAVGILKSLTAREIEWSKDASGRWTSRPVAGTEFTLPCDLVLLALGFVHPVHGKLLADLGVEYDPRGNVKIDGQYQTSVSRVFAAGDVSMGATLIVRAMTAGRQMAAAVHRFLAAQP